MSGSDYAGHIDFEPADFDDLEAVDPEHARIARSNIAHAATQSAQVLAQMPPRFPGLTPPMEIGTPALFWYGGPFDVRRQASGDPFRFRVLLHGRFLQVGDVGRFYVVVARGRSAGSVLSSYLEDATTPGVAEIPASSGVSLYLGEAILDWPSSTASEDVSVRESHGGDRRAATLLDAHIGVWGVLDSGTGLELTGLHVTEWCS